MSAEGTVTRCKALLCATILAALATAGAVDAQTTQPVPFVARAFTPAHGDLARSGGVPAQLADEDYVQALAHIVYYWAYPADSQRCIPSDDQNYSNKIIRLPGRRPVGAIGRKRHDERIPSANAGCRAAANQKRVDGRARHRLTDRRPDRAVQRCVRHEGHCKAKGEAR